MSKLSHRDRESTSLNLARGLYSYADGFRVTNGLAAGPSWNQATHAQREQWMRIASAALGVGDPNHGEP